MDLNTVDIILLSLVVIVSCQILLRYCIELITGILPHAYTMNILGETQKKKKCSTYISQ